MGGSLPVQLGDLDDITAAIVELGDGRAGNIGRFHAERHALGPDGIAIGLDVIGEELDGRLALLERRLLERPWEGPLK